MLIYLYACACIMCKYYKYRNGKVIYSSTYVEDIT